MQLETRYARQAGAHVAFQVCGRGGVDLLFIPGLISHLDLEELGRGIAAGKTSGEMRAALAGRYDSFPSP